MISIKLTEKLWLLCPLLGRKFWWSYVGCVSFAGPHHIFPNDRYPRVLHFKWATSPSCEIYPQGFHPALAAGFFCQIDSEPQESSAHLPMPLIPTPPDRGFCLNCSMQLKAENTHSGLRCGKEYFALAPADRKPQALSRYPETQPTDTCDSWRASEPTKLVAAQK